MELARIGSERILIIMKYHTHPSKHCYDRDPFTLSYQAKRQCTPVALHWRMDTNREPFQAYDIDLTVPVLFPNPSSDEYGTSTTSRRLLASVDSPDPQTIATRGLRRRAGRMRESTSRVLAIGPTPSDAGAVDMMVSDSNRRS